ncbi:ABC transporter permease subunit [Streptomyces sp. enrichment culture]|uniref:ABC transporter permease subunit n=1 Tax=Streptomyces sp. enrichment culture TaxID=1795815 RepID=UPI003F54F93C
MRTTVFTKTLRDNRRSLIGWTTGTTLAAAMYASFYPQMATGGAESVENFPEAMREAFHLDDLTTAAGYLQSSVFGLILPLLALFYGAATGARATAGDEESGTLDLLLAHPVTRTRLILQRFGALAAGAFGIATAVWLTMLAIRESADLTSISPTDFLAQCLNLALLAVAFGALAMGLGAATGRRAVVFAATAGIGVLTYAAHTFAGQLGLDWAAYLSPFHYYIGGEPLEHGFQWPDVAILAGASAVLVAAGTYRFNHRDLNG